MSGELGYWIALALSFTMSVCIFLTVLLFRVHTLATWSYAILCELIDRDDDARARDRINAFTRLDRRAGEPLFPPTDWTEQ